MHLIIKESYDYKRVENHIMRYIKNFMDVYSINNIQKPRSIPSYLMVNFNTSNSPGTHFIAIIFDENEISIYFDPLDLTFIPLEIQN